MVRGVIKVFSGVLTGNWERAWDGLKETARGALQGVLGIMEFIFSPITGAAKALGEAIKAPFQAAWKWIKNAFRTGVDFVLGILSGMLDTAADVIGSLEGVPVLGGKLRGAGG